MIHEFVLVSLVTIMILAKASSHYHAHSFQHFHGPVLDDEKEVSWTDKHGKTHHDYKGTPHYEFAYGVDDKHSGDFHGQKEHRDGNRVSGEYTVKESSGNIRTVKYHADEDGFHAQVLNSHDDHDDEED